VYKTFVGPRRFATLPLRAALAGLLMAQGALVSGAAAAAPVPPAAVTADRGQEAPLAAEATVSRLAKADEGSLAREQRLKRIENLKRSGKRDDVARLMPLLKDSDAQVRREAEQAIWLLWGRSGNADIDRLFRAGVGEMSRGDVAHAIDIFTRVVDLAPTFAEGWNKRATARFVAGDLAGAMDDCERALALLPDHFGSLAGYGHIYFRLDDLDMAIRYWQRALAVNPNLTRVERSIEAAEKLLLRRGRLRT
jgi:tetratricopeptide (TPR) repeat protein